MATRKTPARAMAKSAKRAARPLRSDILGVIARAVGLVGHIIEESRRPMSHEIWHRIEAEATAHMRGRFTRRNRR